MSFSFGGFGTTPAAAPASTGGGLFGAAGTGAATGGGFGFGAAPAATSAFGATTPAPATSTGFGGFGAAPAAAPATGGFGFGAPAASSTAPAASTGFGGFGTAAPAATPASGSAFGGFGGFGAAPATGGFGGFGAAPAASTTQPAASGFGGFGFSAAAAATPAQPQQLISPQTKFADLPEATRKEFMELDSFIQQQSVLRDELNNHSSPLEAGGASSLRSSIDSIATQISSLSLKLNAELLQLSAFESAVSEQYREGESAQRHLNKLLMQMYPSDGRGVGVAGVAAGRVGGASLSDQLVLPSAYHWSKLQEWVSGVTALRAQVATVEEYLATASSQQAQQAAAGASPQALSHVLSSHHSALLSVTARVAALHEQVATVRDKFTALFGREGKARLEEERNKEQHKKEAFDLNAPNAAPLVSSTAQSTSLQSQSAGTATAAAPAATTTTAPAAAGGFGFSLGAPATTAPAAGSSLFGSTATAPAAAPAAAAAAPAAGGFGAFGGGLFGAPAATTAAPAAAGGFGAFGAPASTGLFGGAAEAPKTRTLSRQRSTKR